MPQPDRPGRCRRAAGPAPVALAALVLLGVAAAAPAAAAAQAPGYRRPVPGPVVAPFDPPAAPWGAGNRGVDLRTSPGAPVRASAGGEVRFAGPVAGTLHVTIAHPDGLRTSYSFLAGVDVAVGQPVAAGQVVGVAGSILHWGVRTPSGEYLDPLALLGRPEGAVLLPGGDDGAPRARPGGEVAALAGTVAEVVARHGPDLVGALTGLPTAPSGLAARALAHELWQLHSSVQVADLARVLAERWLLDRPCTPSEVAPPRPPRRRIAVLVGGFGSTDRSAAIDEVDLAALGYRHEDVVRFSYRGGRTPPAVGDRSALAGLGATPYSAEDSQGDLPSSGSALADLLAAVAAAEPGVPIDVLAHSQGGVVTRLALTDEDLPDAVDAVVTVGTPHQGADLATAAVAVAGRPAGAALLDRLHDLGLPPDPSRPALAQLSEVSPVVATLDASPPPPDVRLTSIAARGDLTVPAPRARVAGGPPPVVLDLVGPSAHDRLPGDPRTTREVALALAGLPPTCETAADVLADELVGRTVSWAEDAAGALLAGAVDAGAP